MGIGNHEGQACRTDNSGFRKASLAFSLQNNGECMSHAVVLAQLCT